MPTPDTALVYPGTGLFEGTNLSEGRGTTRPFELVGAPYVDYRWAERARGRDLPGRRLPRGVLHPDVQQARRARPAAASRCTSPTRARFDPIRVGVAMIVAAKAVYSDFAWRKDT